MSTGVTKNNTNNEGERGATGGVELYDAAGRAEPWRVVGPARRRDAEHAELVGGPARGRRPPVARPVDGRHALGQRDPVPERPVLDQVAADRGRRGAGARRQPADDQRAVASPAHAHVARPRRNRRVGPLRRPACTVVIIISLKCLSV